MTDAITSFRIDIEQSQLDDLKHRLRATRFADQIPGTGWELGIDIEYLKDLVRYWEQAYNWRRQEAELNLWNQFCTNIDDQRIHFLHIQSKHAAATPLLMVHGWPGSFIEFSAIIDLLVNPEPHGRSASDAFHLIIPSRPGYGFSGITRNRGWCPSRIARTFAELMRRLGYRRYGVQGGDWGAIVTERVALCDPDHVIGLHTNMPIADPPAEPISLAQNEESDLADTQRFIQTGAAYSAIQGTRPQTIGQSLNDSPAGLCAWIIEKFRSWSDCDGDLESVFTRDQLLTNVMLYWLTGTATSAARLYFEAFRGGLGSSERINTPTGVARFPKELVRQPRAWIERRYNVVRWSNMPRGGHFAAMEQPELLAGDIAGFFRDLR
jgi:pimeloyl-ACP methyl ester carboxylesterase